MTMRTAAALFALCASLLVVAPASAITGGSADTTHPYVGAARNGVNVCSGTLVAPTLFLTAAHCFSDTTSVFGTDANGNPIVHVKFDLPNGSRLVVTGENHGDPQFCSACKSGTPGVLAHDLAVVTLDTAVAIPGYGYPSLARDGFDATLPMGTNALIVGYGTQDFETGGGNPQPLNNGLRYAAQTQLNQSNGTLSDSFLKLASSQSSGNGGICFGDSGGPVLDGSTILAVDSFVMNGDCKGVSYAYRVDTPAAQAFLSAFGL
jgi:secreted trypsin-like serine protease